MYEIMYCKRVLDYLLSEAKSSKSFDVRIVARRRLGTCLNVLPAVHTVVNKTSNHQRLQRGTAATTFSCLCQNRNIQTAEVHFPTRCKKNTDEEHLVNSNSSNFEEPVSYEYLSSRLQKCWSVQDQIEELCRVLCLGPEDIRSRERLCLRIREMLLPFLKNCNVQMFGSSVNGFGFKGCDIDMSLNIIGDNRKPQHSYPSELDNLSVHDLMAGRVSPEFLARLPQKAQLYFIHSVFQEYYKESSEPIFFISAYVPIVRFYHNKLKCDLSFGNRVAFINSKLLKLCGLLDERARQLMIIVRFWAKHVGLIAGGLTFNTYTISLLVLYFLQTRKPPVLPSVEHLLTISEYLKNDNMEDDSYLQDIKKVPPSENKQTIVELLREFFFFCAYFDYSQVICPLTASSVPRAKILAHNKNFKLNTICIQDPIRLSHNVATLVEFKQCRQLLVESLMAIKLFHEENMLSPSSAKWGILSLLEKPEDYSIDISNIDHLLSFRIQSIPSSTENEENKAFYFPNNKMKQAWFQKMSQTVRYILEYALLFECKVKENVERPGQSHCDFSQSMISEHQSLGVDDYQPLHVFEISDYAVTSSDLLRPREPSMTINCVAYQNTWTGREDLRMRICLTDSFSGPLEMEHAVSVKLVDVNQRKEDDRREMYSFVCECYELDCGKHTSLLVKFKPFQGTSFNPILGLFLKDYIPKTVIKVLKSTNSQFPEQQNVLNRV